MAKSKCRQGPGRWGGEPGSQLGAGPVWEGGGCSSRPAHSVVMWLGVQTWCGQSSRFVKKSQTSRFYVEAYFRNAGQYLKMFKYHLNLKIKMP